MYSRDMNKLLEKTFGICVKKDVTAEETLPKNILFELRNTNYYWCPVKLSSPIRCNKECL